MFLGVDVSTTAAKALLLAQDGEVLDCASTPLTLSSPRALWSEQSPEDWWQGVVASIRRVLKGRSPAQVAGVGLTGQMHGLTLLSEVGEVLRPAILWNDQRTAAECEEIRARVGRQRLIELTGNDVLTGFTAPKLLWVQNNEPDIYTRVRHCLLPKDYVRYRLSGEFATDVADASGTGWLDLRARRWSSELLRVLQVDESWLPTTHEGNAVSAHVSRSGCEQTGLLEGTPIVAGAGDQGAQAIGAGALREGICAVTLGTSGVVFASTDRPLIEPEARLHSFCHGLPQRWHLMGVMLSAAGSLQWYRDALFPETSFEVLMAEAQQAPRGCNGLRFLPYLSGERTPHADPFARGAFIGLTLGHSRAHMTRALLEGVAFGLRECFDLMRRSGVAEFAEVRVSGGGAKSALWCEILAEVLAVPLRRVEESEGAALGAARLAWSGVLGADLDDVPVRLGGCIEPCPEGVECYLESAEHYSKIYPLLRPLFGG